MQQALYWELGCNPAMIGRIFNRSHRRVSRTVRAEFIAGNTTTPWDKRSPETRALAFVGAHFMLEVYLGESPELEPLKRQLGQYMPRKHS